MQCIYISDEAFASHRSIPRCYSVEDPQTAAGLEPAAAAASPAGPFLGRISESSQCLLFPQPAILNMVTMTKLTHSTNQPTAVSQAPSAARRSSTSRGLGASLQAAVRNSRSLSFADGGGGGGAGANVGAGGPAQQKQQLQVSKK